MVGTAITLGAKVLADFGVVTAVRCGIGMVTSPYTLSTFQKVTLGVAEVAISGVVADKVNNYIDDTCEQIAEIIVNKDLDKKFAKGGKK